MIRRSPRRPSGRPPRRCCPAHPGRRRLEDLELGGARLGLLEQLGVGEGDRGMRGQGADERDVAARPVRGSRVTADSAPMTRSWWMSGAIRWPATWNAVVRTVAWVDRRERPGRPGRGRCAGPRRPSPRRGRKTGSRRRHSSGRPAQAATSRLSSCRTRIVVASARRARFVSSTTIRNSSARSCEAASRPAMPRTVSSRSASSASRARVGVRVMAPIGSAAHGHVGRGDDDGSADRSR